MGRSERTCSLAQQLAHSGVVNLEASVQPAAHFWQLTSPHWSHSNIVSLQPWQTL
jgi:hypothetical protein